MGVLVRFGLDRGSEKAVGEGRNKRALVVPAAIGGLACAALVMSGGLWLNYQGDPCTAPTYDPEGRLWHQLPPANVEQSSNDCVGFCFNAAIDGVESERVARVVILEEDGALRRALVERPEVRGISDFDAAERSPLRFACFWSDDSQGRTPHFRSCAEMAAFYPSAPGCEPEPEPELLSKRGPLEVDELDADRVFELW